MIFKRLGSGLLLLILITSACGQNNNTPTPAAPTPEADSFSGSTTLIAKSVVKSDPVDIAPGVSVEIQTPTPTHTIDSEPVFGSVFIKNATLEMPDGSSVPLIRIQGMLPTPCHKLIMKIDPISDNRQIGIHVLSSANLQLACDQKLQPFDQTIRLTSIPAGNYTVWVNGNKITSIIIH